VRTLTKSILDWAEVYTRNGLSVIPIYPRSKEPNLALLKEVNALNSQGIPSWKPYCSHQPTSKEVNTWFANKTTDNVSIAIVMRDVNSLDIDNKAYYPVFLDKPPESLGTWIFQTSKGFQVLLGPSPNITKNVEFPGHVELKVHDKYVVAPPSIHPSGAEYRWLTDPERTPIRNLHPEEYDVLVEKIRFFKRHHVVITEMVQLWTLEHRHNLSLWLSGVLRKQNLSEVDALQIVESICKIAGDTETPDRLTSVRNTYTKSLNSVAGFSKLKEELVSTIGPEKARDLATRIRLENSGNKRHGASPDNSTQSVSAEANEFPWKPCPTPQPYTNLETIFNTLKHSLMRYIEFPDQRCYDVVAAWTLSSWLIEIWRAHGPLYFLAPTGSGKTTALEWLEEVVYRGIRGGSMSLATMFRLSHAFTPTLLIDESQIYNREIWAEAQSFFDERYRRGGRVWRMEGEGKNMFPKFFDAFGATALASKTPPWESLMDRALLIAMEKTNRKDLEETLTPAFFAEGERLRAQLSQYRSDNVMGDVSRDSVKELLRKEIGNPRIREAGFPLLCVAPKGEPSNNILRYLKDLEQDHEAEQSTGFLADYVRALEKCRQDGGKVSAKEARYHLAHILGEVEVVVFIGVNGEEKREKLNDRSLPKPRRVMSVLKTLGFKKTRMSNGSTGILWDEGLFARLKLRYANNYSPTTESSVSSESSDHEGKRASQTEDAEVSEDSQRGKDLCRRCWTRKYERLPGFKKQGAPRTGSCADCNEPASIRVSFPPTEGGLAS